MMCLALGLGIFGALAFAKARRLRRAYYFGGGCGPFAGGGCDGGWHGHHHHHHHGFGGWHRRRRWVLGAALQRIEATPAQERAIVAEVDRLEQRLKAARGGLADLRGELGEVLRGPSVDDAALAGLTGRIDTATGEARAALLDALRNLHQLLDEKQRERVADLLGKGGGWRGPGGGGPYRM